MIFKVVHGKQVRDVNDNIDSVPAFVDCNDKVLKYVILMYDYDSPYSRLPHSLREEQVLVNIEYTNPHSARKFFQRHKSTIEAAKNALIEIQYDSQMESLISCKTQMRLWDELLRKENKSDKEKALAAKIFDKMPSYMKRVVEMEEIVGYREKYDNDEDSPKTALERYLEMKRQNNGLSG